MILLLLTVIYIYQPRSQALLSFSIFSREEERRPWKRGFKHNTCYRKCCSLFPPLFAITVIDSYEFVPVMK